MIIKKLLGITAIAILTSCATIYAGNPGLGISWVCISNCTDNVDDSILLQRSPDLGTNWTSIASLATNILSYTDAVLPDRATFSYRVAAVASCCGTGDWSNVVSKTTKGKPIKVFLIN